MATVVGEPVLDHLALASRRSWDNLIRYGYQLGGRWLGGPIEPDGDHDNGNNDEQDPAFYFCQLGFANGTKLEFIEPLPGPGSEFIRRFLHRNGPGPHHLTYKVSDIEAVMTAATGAGYRVVNESLDDPNWKEAFLHPTESHGIVIQMAQHGPDSGWEDPAPLPPTDQAGDTTIDAVTHLVADLDRATELFTKVFGMTEVQRDDHRLGSRVVLTSGPWTLALIAPTDEPARQWLGPRAGRLLQVEMSVPEPSVVPGLLPVGDRYELAPEINLGTRLLLRQRR